MARFYVDEDLGLELVRLLGDAGHDVQYSLEAGNEGKPDAFHLRHAMSQSAITLTGNREDFRFLHRLWSALAEFGLTPGRHPGILTSSRRVPALDWSAAIQQLLTEESDVTGAFFSFNPQTGIWHRDRF